MPRILLAWSLLPLLAGCLGGDGTGFPSPVGSIFLSSTTVNFSAAEGETDPYPQIVTVTSSGTGFAPLPTVQITYNSGAGWLTAAAITETAEPYTITLSATVGSLTAGISYTASVTVDVEGADNSPQTIDVTFDVIACAPSEPFIGLSNTDLLFTATKDQALPSPQDVQVDNLAGGSLAIPTAPIFYTSVESGWLSATVTGASAPYTVSVQPIITSMSAGEYAATISVDSTGTCNGPQVINVTFRISTPGVFAPTWQAVQDNVFTPRCTACHIGAAAPMGLKLDAANSYAMLVGVDSIEQPDILRVAPFDPDNSYIIMKLEGAAGISGSQMPLNPPPLNPADIQVIRQWIENGANP